MVVKNSQPKGVLANDCKMMCNGIDGDDNKAKAQLNRISVDPPIVECQENGE